MRRETFGASTTPTPSSGATLSHFLAECRLPRFAADGRAEGRALVEDGVGAAVVYKAWVWCVAWDADYWFGGPSAAEASKSWTREGDYAEWSIDFVELADG
jgi:hypothetical protein